MKQLVAGLENVKYYQEDFIIKITNEYHENSDRWARSHGYTCRSTLLESVSPESVRDNWDKITDMTDPLFLESNEEAAGMLANVSYIFIIF